MSWWGDNVSTLGRDTAESFENQVTQPFSDLGHAGEEIVKEVSGYNAAQDAQQLALDTAEHAAEIERESTAEQRRVMEGENRRAESMARARAAASGLTGASTELYINSLIASGREDIDWLNRQGELLERAQLDEGQAAYNDARFDMWGTIMGGAQLGAGLFSMV